MSKTQVTFKPTSGGLNQIATSAELGNVLEGVARPVLEAARQDPNEAFVASLRMRRYTTTGRGRRVRIQIGAAPIIGARVEAKRGTLARALGRVG